jgi:cytochrome c-type biogenesis protein CcmH/NrfF
MWGFTTVVGAFALALIAMSFAFSGGGVVVAIPVAFLAVGVAVLADLRRRRKQSHTMDEFRDQARTEKVEFTDRDKETLHSE